MSSIYTEQLKPFAGKVLTSIVVEKDDIKINFLDGSAAEFKTRGISSIYTDVHVTSTPPPIAPQTSKIQPKSETERLNLFYEQVSSPEDNFLNKQYCAATIMDALILHGDPVAIHAMMNLAGMN